MGFGAQILKVVLDFDLLTSHGMPPREAMTQLRQQTDQYDPQIIAALESLDIEPSDSQRKALKVSELDVCMILEEDVRAANGSLLVTKGQELTYPVLVLLRRWAQRIPVREPIHVLVPTYSEAPAEPAAAAVGPAESA